MPFQIAHRKLCTFHSSEWFPVGINVFTTTVFFNEYKWLSENYFIETCQ